MKNFKLKKKKYPNEKKYTERFIWKYCSNNVEYLKYLDRISHLQL